MVLRPSPSQVCRFCRLRAERIIFRLPLQRTESTKTQQALHPAIPRTPSWSPREFLKSSTINKPPIFTKTEVAHLARLAGLNIKPDDLEKYTHDINDLCAMVDPIRSVDTQGVEPLVSLVRDYNATRTQWREDVIQKETDEPSGRALLKSARKTDGPYYVVDT
ncbi:aspartyl/glutamyl-tRNA(Asn/Gln) amidotransferase, C subunit [Spizellomyces punctatus DAOM BR117]|uniref:Aspartyl/glutamyl-tRNA(Asn/Gln) amidotransferase, C subunit n=1 Tax=Spizellomyces punctatus (strain DAOM BR117) TaxID=645134 RepID=A0A0L0HUC8_SPIPD|nr:aspartyl/glutamyl-tRNA(Asn/Gln) amidotransferase, C subunit [Spizellomyces punctatus DAOM BR117]KND04687.1 aspartyl/glutamyl-tRNA(Asn/Gln) amidotransferase, C subunit [Spizellomyces punctatus DAOM BR117]|eukprot:XP_016612726.1 aspartyl/glutamyl-tRNA(Asn/Gln) amidotransferase, C subunit [Spizellomyces punctatus DAOM BR117]